MLWEAASSTIEIPRPDVHVGLVSHSSLYFLGVCLNMAQHKPGRLKQTNKKHKGTDGKRAQIKSLGAGKTNGQRKNAKSNALKDM